MGKISCQREVIRLRLENGESFDSPSWLKCQDFLRNSGKRVENFSIIYNGREFCLWPSGRNYWYSKKIVCFPGGKVLDYRYVGFTQGRLLLKQTYRMPEFHPIEKQILAITEKDKDFLLC